MRLLKGIVLFLLAVIIMLGVISLFLPDTARVERSTVINAPAETVFQKVNSLKAFTQWSPWSAADPNMQLTFSGPDEGVGAKVAWSSMEKNVGTGTQEIIESRTNEFVKTHLTFGWGNPAQADFTLTPAENGTQVTWGMFSHLPNPIEKYFGLMMDKWVGGMYEQGLATLKAQVEGK